MSYWVYLHKAGTEECVSVDRHFEGGTQVLGGNEAAELNVTYNYSKHWRVKGVDGMKAYDTIPTLSDAVKRLGTERADDYWDPTPGNVGFMCSILLAWARQHPDAGWEVH